MRDQVTLLNEVRAQVLRQGQDGDVPRRLTVTLPGAAATLDQVIDQVTLLH